jgi:hypothetical protein
MASDEVVSSSTPRWLIVLEMADRGFEGRPMTRSKWRWPGLLPILLGFTVLGLHPGQARAQWGMGYGWGWGELGFRYVPSPTDFLNQQALTRGRQERPSHSPYANNPNAYFNRIRDNGFVSHYDVARRRAPAYQPVRTTAYVPPTRVEPQPAAATAASRPVTPLASFFNAAQELVWPSESPTNGDLKEKRDRADQAGLAVLEETRRQVPASVSSVTRARQKLIDYGQPALQEVRAQATPPIADSFHNFLLSLYDSLAQAAWPPDANSGTAPNP